MLRQIIENTMTASILWAYLIKWTIEYTVHIWLSAYDLEINTYSLLAAEVVYKLMKERYALKVT